jgi:hypothetical protein
LNNHRKTLNNIEKPWGTLKTLDQELEKSQNMIAIEKP